MFQSNCADQCCLICGTTVCLDTTISFVRLIFYFKFETTFCPAEKSFGFLTDMSSARDKACIQSCCETAQREEDVLPFKNLDLSNAIAASHESTHRLRLLRFIQL